MRKFEFLMWEFVFLTLSSPTRTWWRPSSLPLPLADRRRGASLGDGRPKASGPTAKCRRKDYIERKRELFFFGGKLDWEKYGTGQQFLSFLLQFPFLSVLCYYKGGIYLAILTPWNWTSHPPFLGTFPPGMPPPPGHSSLSRWQQSNALGLEG